ncbi:MAG: hypothetical protein K8953_11835, partial [Proteobacteria bacterium]|nr:hypothetical protein [Pseudomonadota bacterium]
MAALANRVKFCSGDVAEADLNLCTFKESSDHKTTQDMLCMSSGRYANPFVNLCAGVANDELRATFLDRCQNDIPALDGATSCAFVMACMEDPYGADCVNNRTYFASRWAITDECEMLGVGEFTATCTEDIKARIQACLDAPYADGCKDNRDYDMVRLNFVNTCGDSKVVRTAAGAEDTRCRVAFDTFCVGDNLFTNTGANCLGDEGYKDDRDTHFAECRKAESARAPLTDCTIAFDQICQGGESIYTDPFVSLCKEGERDSLMARQAVIERCVQLTANEWEAENNESCNTNGANTILSNCGEDPFSLECADYSEAYAMVRTMRVADCGTGFEDRCDGTQARLCVSSDNAEAAPLSPACDNEEGIADTRSDFLEACAGDAGVRDCSAAIATAVKTACDLDP